MEDVYLRGQDLGRGDLGITMLEGPSGDPKDLGVVNYAIYFLDDPERPGTLFGPPGRTAATPEKGEYYINLKIPEEAPEGRYRTVWYWKESEEEEVSPQLVTSFRVEGRKDSV